MSGKSSGNARWVTELSLIDKEIAMPEAVCTLTWFAASNTYGWSSKPFLFRKSQVPHHDGTIVEQ